MKIEMGESLFYSWLRHVKKCQIVQTNWKVSSQWNLSNEDDLKALMDELDAHYREKHDYDIFKRNASLSQLLQQGECDVLGISMQQNEPEYYAVDVAFHEGGLNYGSRHVTVMKVLKKCARTAFCLHGYLSTKKAEIIFASPRINPSVLETLLPCVEEMQEIFKNKGYAFAFRVIANEEYGRKVLDSIFSLSDRVADTSELFLRSYQMYRMFSETRKVERRILPVECAVKADLPESDYTDADAYQELRIGQLAQKVLGDKLRNGYVTEDEIAAMQTAEYSKQNFHLQYPLLKVDTGEKGLIHYYKKPIKINGTNYRMCCEWFEQRGRNNDRPYLLEWIKKHKDKQEGTGCRATCENGTL